MKTIYKYLLADHHKTSLQVPKGSDVLSVGIDSSQGLCVWIMVDQNTLLKEELQFQVFWTGDKDINPDGLKFIGTVGLFANNLILHVFLKEE